MKNIAKPVGAYKVLMDRRVTTAEVLGVARPKARTNRFRKIAFACAATLFVAIVAAAVWQFLFHKTPSAEDSVDLRKVALPVPGRASIAVLPFQNMTGDPQQDYLSEGMAEQIITGLSQSPDIYVTSRTSSFAYKGKSMTAQQIANQLGVRYLLEGSVQRDAGRVRINMQVIDGRNGNHIWSQRYDRQFEDIFALQDQIMMDVMEALNIKFIAGFSGTSLSTSLKDYRPSNFKAYEADLKGANFYFRRTRQVGYTATKHQREVGTGYCDALTQCIGGGHSSLSALAGSTEDEQFLESASHSSNAPLIRGRVSGPFFRSTD